MATGEAMSPVVLTELPERIYDRRRIATAANYDAVGRMSIIDGKTGQTTSLGVAASVHSKNAH